MTDGNDPTADEYTASAAWAATHTADEATLALAKALREAKARQEPLALAELQGAVAALSEAIAQATPSRQDAQPQTLGAVARGYWDRFADRREAAPTGLAALDEALGGGLQPGRLVALLGGPGAGKTALACQLAEHIADAGRPVVYLTLEDGAHILTAKTLARLYDLDYGAVMNGYENQRARIMAALASLAQRRSAERLLYVEDTGRLSLAQLAAIARAHFERYNAEREGASGGGAGLLVVDYLQRWARAQRGADAREDLRQAVGRAADELSNLSRALGCTVLALSSVNRASGYGDNGDSSVLASAKEAGDIEFSADVVAGIVKAKHDTPMGYEARKLRLDKNRQGAVAEIALNWRGARQQFTGVSK
jgi:replicative DNA helicase